MFSLTFQKPEVPIRDVTFDLFSISDYIIQLESQDEISIFKLNKGYFRTSISLEYTYKVQKVADRMEIYGLKQNKEVKKVEIKNTNDTKQTAEESSPQFMDELKFVLSKRIVEPECRGDEDSQLNLDTVVITKTL